MYDAKYIYLFNKTFFPENINEVKKKIEHLHFVLTFCELLTKG